MFTHNINILGSHLVWHGMQWAYDQVTTSTYIVSICSYQSQ